MRASDGASELGNFSPFSHSKTAISFNILLVLISETHIFSGLNYIFIYIQSMQFPVITYGMALYINDSYVKIPTKH